MKSASNHSATELNAPKVMDLRSLELWNFNEKCQNTTPIHSIA
jgi:hypothetical protein